jgi:hypothetical protein
LVEADSAETLVSTVAKAPRQTKVTKKGKSPAMMQTTNTHNQVSPLRPRSARAAKGPIRKKPGHPRVG